MRNNKMTRPTLFLASLVGLIACGQTSNQKISLKDTSQKMTNQKEIWTLYYQQDTTFHIKRLVTDDRGLLLLNYDINTSEPEAAKQTFISGKTVVDENEADKIYFTQHKNVQCFGRKIEI